MNTHGENQGGMAVSPSTKKAREAAGPPEMPKKVREAAGPPEMPALQSLNLPEVQEDGIDLWIVWDPDGSPG